MGKFGLKTQYCQFNVKFGSSNNLNMQNSMVVLTFFVSKGKHPFWANLVKKSKIVTLN